MRERLLHPFRPSPGEWRLLTAGALIAVMGAVTAFITVTQFQTNQEITPSWSRFDLWCAFAGAAGAVQGLYLFRAWLGQPGALGTLRAVFGVVLVVLSGAVIAGTLILPIYGTMFGPALAGVAILDHPMLSLAWGWGLILIHVMVRDWRVERVSYARRMQNWR